MSLGGLVGCANPIFTSPNVPPQTPQSAEKIGSHLWQQQVTVEFNEKASILNQTASFRVNNLPVAYLLEALHLENKIGYEVDECGSLPVSLVGHKMKVSDVLESIQRQTETVAFVENNHIRVQCDDKVLRIYSLDALAIERRMADESRLHSNLDHRNESHGSRPGNQSEFRISNNQVLNIWDHLVEQVQLILQEGQEVQLTHQEKRSEEDKTRDYSNNRGLQSQADQNQNRFDVTVTRKTKLSGSVVAHPESATLAVTATEKQHRAVAKWLHAIEGKLTEQVAIEAVIAEIVLNNSFQKGIDWRAFQERGLSLGLSVQGLDVPQPSFSVSVGRTTNQSETSVVLKLLEEFGTTSVISSPRIVTLNQQTAVLKLIDNRVFFSTDVQTSAPTNNAPAFSTVRTEVQTVPVGFLMTVTPLVTQNRSIQLRIRPTLTRILGFVPDPNPALANLDIVSRIPEIQTREIESILQLRDGELALLGGLKQLSSNQTDRSIPGFSDPTRILTESTDQNRNQSELVILLRAKILNKNLTNTPFQQHNKQLNQFLQTATQLQSDSSAQAKRFLQVAHQEFEHSPEVTLNLSILAARENRFDEALSWADHTDRLCPVKTCPLPALQWRVLLESLTPADHSTRLNNVPPVTGIKHAE